MTFSTHWLGSQSRIKWISTSKSEAMVLSRKAADCPLQLGNESIPQVKEFKYLEVLFTSEGTMAREIGQRIGALVKQHHSLVTKREPSQKANLLIYQSVFIHPYTYDHEGWVMIEIMRSRIQEAEMGFLRRVAGISLRDKVKGSVFPD